MKPFDLEAAQKGAKVCTRSGNPARIIAFDAKMKSHSIIALVDLYDNRGETVISYTSVGRHCSNGATSIYDLVMAPTKIRKWINVYRTLGKARKVGKQVFATKRSAERAGHKSVFYIATIPIEWEE